MTAAATVKFFNNKRPEIEVGDFHILQSTGQEKRIKLQLRIPISNRPLTGIPDWIQDGYQFVVKDGSVYRKSITDGVRLEGITVTFFATDKAKQKSILLAGSTMDRFSVEKIGKDDKAMVFLNFVLYAPCTRIIASWAYEQTGTTMFAEFDSTQASFSYSGESEEEEAEDTKQADLPGVPPTKKK